MNRASPIKKIKRRKFFSKLVLFIFVLSILFIVVGFLSRLPKYSINEVEVRGTESLDGSVVASSVIESLKGYKLLVYSRASIFLYSKKEVSSFISSAFPRVYKVISIDREKQKLIISIEERHGAYTWCGHVAPTFEKRFQRDKCYFLDQEGFAFAEAPNFTEGVYLSIYGGLPIEGETIGETINLQNNITDVAKMLEILEDNDLPVHSLVLKADGQHEFLLDAYTLNGNYSRIIWNEDIPLSETLSKLGSALSEENFKEEWKEKSAYFEYIDTRFNNRVFYKFSDAEQKQN